MKHIINYKPKEFAELLNVSVKTLQRWDRDGVLVAKRTPTDRRYYTYDQYLVYKGITSNNDSRKTVIYTRVSTNAQRADLLNQKKFLIDFANAKGIIVDELIEEIGSGLNYNRKEWNNLLEQCMENKIESILITHKDRFIRFGYDWFERFVGKYNVKIIIVNNELLSSQEELIQDITSIVHVFGSKIDGMRKYKKQILEDEELIRSLQGGNKANVETKIKD